MSQQRVAPCPVCKKPAEPLGRNPRFPFCSDRCRRIDLGRWFGEEYRMPARPGDGEDTLPPADDSNER